MRVFVFAVALSVLLTSTGCLFAEENKSADGRERIQIKVNDKELMVEVADSPSERSKGLMHRESMAENHGMLFVFEDERKLSFWMKNTLIPLTIGYFDKKGKLIDIQDMQPESVLVRELKVYESSGPAMYALETNIGWFKKNGVEVGAQLYYGSLGKSKK